MGRYVVIPSTSFVVFQSLPILISSSILGTRHLLITTKTLAILSVTSVLTSSGGILSGPTVDVSSSTANSVISRLEDPHRLQELLFNLLPDVVFTKFNLWVLF